MTGCNAPKGVCCCGATSMRRSRHVVTAGEDSSLTWRRLLLFTFAFVCILVRIWRPSLCVCVCVCVMTIAITVRPLRGDRWLHFHTPWSVESFDRRRSIHFDSATPGHASFRSLFLLYFLGFLSFFFSAKIRRCLATDLALVASRIGYGSHGFIIIIIIFKYRKHQKSKRNGGRTIPSLAKEWP